MPILRLAALLALAAAVAAQPARDAAALVREVAAAAFAAKSWQAEGTLVRSENGADQPPVKFRLAFQPPRYARLEILDGENPVLRVCNGAGQWMFYPRLKGFVKVMLPQIGPCAFPLNAWAAMDKTLANPKAGARDRVAVNGHPQPCQIVRGSFTWLGRDPVVNETVTMCIDAEKHRILRYQLAHASPAPAWSETYTFSSMQADTVLSTALFDFQAPEGSHDFATIDWLTPIPIIPGVYQVSDAVSAPVLLAMKAPAAPAAAWPSADGHAVTIRVQIGRDGLVQAIDVVGPAGAALDEAAVKCVNDWRFQPGVSADGPEVVAGTIQVHFGK